MANIGMKDFNARVKKIQKPSNKSYYDPDLGMHIPKRVSRTQIKKVQKSNETTPSSLLTCAFTGAGAMIIAQLGRIYLSGLPYGADFTLAVDLIAGFLLMVIFAGMVGYSKMVHRIAYTVGFVVALVTIHNAFWYGEDRMAYVYPADYIAHIKDTTVQDSIVFRDMVLAR